MFQPRCKVPGKSTFFLPVVLVFLSCSFIDLRPIGISTVPAAPWTLLPEEYSHVILAFDTEMERRSVEKAIQLFSPNGSVETLTQWEGKDLHLIPVSPWRPGIRYGLKLSGVVSASDGREATLSRDIPFFAIHHSPLPYVKSFFPPDQGSVGIHGPLGEPGQVLLELNFSRSMDTRSAEAALKFEIPGEKKIRWEDNEKTMLISSGSALNPWVVYRWSISEKALSAEGAPLAREFSGRFITDLDREFITVVRVIPLLAPETTEEASTVIYSSLWGSWLPAGLSLAPGPGSGHGIGVEFSKPVDSDSLARAFSFIPSVPGRVEILSPVSAVFIPSKDMESETDYQMRISGSLKDSEGLKMGDDYIASFRTDIPNLYVNSISFVQDEIYEAPKPLSLFQVKVTPEGIVRCILNFSLSFEPAVREESAFRISLRPFFPLTLPPVSLSAARWIKGDRLLLEWEGPEGGNVDEAHYYKLLIPGALHNGRGSSLKTDLVLYLEAEHE